MARIRTVFVIRVAGLCESRIIRSVDTCDGLSIDMRCGGSDRVCLLLKAISVGCRFGVRKRSVRKFGIDSLGYTCYDKSLVKCVWQAGK